MVIDFGGALALVWLGVSDLRGPRSIEAAMIARPFQTSFGSGFKALEASFAWDLCMLGSRL